VHPDHINNFISGDNNNNAPYYGGNSKDNGGGMMASGDDSKTIIYHDKDGVGNYPSELLVRNQVSASK